MYGIALDIAAQTPGTLVLQCNSAASHAIGGLPGIETIDVVSAQTNCMLGSLGKQKQASAHCSRASGIVYMQVYAVYFKCNKRLIREYPNLRNYTAEIYQMPGNEIA